MIAVHRIVPYCTCFCNIAKQSNRIYCHSDTWPCIHYDNRFDWNLESNEWMNLFNIEYTHTSSIHRARYYSTRYDTESIMHSYSVTVTARYWIGLHQSVLVSWMRYGMELTIVTTWTWTCGEWMYKQFIYFQFDLIQWILLDFFCPFISIIWNIYVLDNIIY